MTNDEKKDLAWRMLKILEDKDLEYKEAIEVTLNVFGFIAIESGLSMHGAIGVVMSYYKKHADH